MSWIPPDHPRAKSLRIREKLAEGFRAGLLAPEGLAAHGRGEAFDYLLGEKTTPVARWATRAAAAQLLLAEKPVISINGNAAALAPRELVELAEATGTKLEINLFHESARRRKKIFSWLKKHGAEEVLGADEKFLAKIPEIHSNRRWVDKRGILVADAVLVPLEDGDRTEALKKMGKRVITIDLNPMSRTARAAHITVVDNIVRAMPLMVEEARRLRKLPRKDLEQILKIFSNDENLRASFEVMVHRLRRFARK